MQCLIKQKYLIVSDENVIKCRKLFEIVPYV